MSQTPDRAQRNRMLRRRSHKTRRTGHVNEENAASATGAEGEPSGGHTDLASPAQTNAEELAVVERARTQLHVDPQPLAPFGFAPRGDRSSAVPTGKPGSSIVGAAKGLRERRQGKVSINGTIATEGAKKMMAHSDAVRAARKAARR